MSLKSQSAKEIFVTGPRTAHRERAGKDAVKSAREAILELWGPIVTTTDRALQRGFKPSATRLMIVEAVHGQRAFAMASVAFESDPDKRIQQIAVAFTVATKSITLPVGVVFVRKDNNKPARDEHEVVLPGIVVVAAAQYLQRDPLDLADAFLEAGAAIASNMLGGLDDPVEN